MRTEVYAVLNPDKMLRGQNCGAFFIHILSEIPGVTLSHLRRGGRWRQSRETFVATA